MFVVLKNGRIVNLSKFMYISTSEEMIHPNVGIHKEGYDYFIFFHSEHEYEKFNAKYSNEQDLNEDLKKIHIAIKEGVWLEKQRNKRLKEISDSLKKILQN